MIFGRNLSVFPDQMRLHVGIDDPSGLLQRLLLARIRREKKDVLKGMDRPEIGFLCQNILLTLREKIPVSWILLAIIE